MQIVCKLHANACEFSCTSDAYLHACMHVNLHAFRTQFACKKMHAKNAYKMYTNHVQTTCKRHANLHTFGCILHAFLHANCVRNACKSCANFTQDAIEFVSISVAIRKQKCIQNVCILHSGAPVE